MAKKVIIIDDNLISLNLIKTAFASRNWEVYGVQQAKKALDILYDIAPDIIITDALMPVIGGFQLLRILRKNPKTEKIPVIVYSVLDDKHSKYYIKNERAEYYLQKTENTDEIVNMAEEVVRNHPLDDDYKYEILKTNIAIDYLMEDDNKIKEEIKKKPPVIYEELEAKFKKYYDFTKSDDKILGNIFPILHQILEYDLAIICTESFEKKEKTAYFDIRDIILSPIFQNNILNLLEAKHSFLFKKYAPNLKVITNEEEFPTKIKFNFEHDKKITASVIFYSKEKSKWINNQDIDTIKNVLNAFFRARHINKSSKVTKTNNLSNKYFMDKLDFKFDNQNKKNIYTAILEISNYKELQNNLAPDELDFVNSKISERLINFIGDDEQIYKNEDEEYNLVFFAKNKDHANQKLNWIIDIINEINIDGNHIEILIGASDCNIEGQFNFYEAQKQARLALDNATNQNRIIMYDTK